MAEDGVILRGLRSRCKLTATETDLHNSAEQTKAEFYDCFTVYSSSNNLTSS